MSSSKAVKILRRTLVGVSLATALGLALWWTSRSEHGEPVVYVTGLCVIVAVFEVARMGRLAERTLQPVLLVAVCGALFLAWRAIGGVAYEASIAELVPDGGLRPAVYRANLPTAYAWTAMLALAAYGSLHALGRVLARSGAAVRAILYLGFGALILFAMNDTAEVGARLRPAFVVLAILALTTLPLIVLDRAWTSLAIAVGIALWLIPPLPALWEVWLRWGIHGLIALLVLSKIGDTAGYYVGSAIGKSHPFPRISPGKTTAGCVASLATATAVGGVLAAVGWLPENALGIGGGLLAGALVNVAAQSGDLFESWVKRRTGVKDSSGAFGPAGGMLDQIDSLLVSVPVALATWPAIFS